MTKFINTQLQILQLEGYSTWRFLNWWRRHPLTFNLLQKKPLVYTAKVRYLLLYTKLLYLLTAIGVFINPLYLLPLFTLIIQPFPLLFLALLIHKPYELINRRRTIARCRQQITHHPHLTVVAITGSYGKTSTKDFLYEIVSHFQTTIKTPESYNTVFGISLVLDLELTSKVKYFICEMAAYVRGEIKELTQQVPPNFAILTTIGNQHLERFKSLENTTLAKFELIDAVDPKNALVNLDNPYIAAHLKLPQYQGVKTYSFHDDRADFYVSSYRLTPLGTTFTIRHQGKDHSFSTPLFGTSNLQNLVAAVSMSLILQIPQPIIKAVLTHLQPSPHRLELKPINSSTLVDDAYSSNQLGFTQIIDDLNKLKGKKALLTPGIIELGSLTIPIHHQLGESIGTVFDTVYLVGHSDRTKALEQGIRETGSQAIIHYLTDHHQLWPTINQLAANHSWILLENDLPDNY